MSGWNGKSVSRNKVVSIVVDQLKESMVPREETQVEFAYGAHRALTRLLLPGSEQKRITFYQLFR